MIPGTRAHQYSRESGITDYVIADDIAVIVAIKTS
jgi:hypothetical protein